jgi:hypothetical protein
MTQKKDRRRWGKRVTDLSPILRTVVLLGAVGIPSVMGDLVGVAPWISRQKLGGTLARHRVGRIDHCVMEVDRNYDLLAAESLDVRKVLGHGQSF